MIANSREPIGGSAAAIEDGSIVCADHDRRRRIRLPLQLPVRFYRGKGEAPIRGTTQDMSSDGFFCFAQANFTPGESIVCTLEYPAYAPGLPDSKLVITCRVRIIRLVSGATRELNGVGCQIQDFECSYLTHIRNP